MVLAYSTNRRPVWFAQHADEFHFWKSALLHDLTSSRKPYSQFLSSAKSREQTSHSDENSNGLLRQYFHQGMELNEITEEQVHMAKDRLIVGREKYCAFKTPHEVFFGVEVILHQATTSGCTSNLNPRMNLRPPVAGKFPLWWELGSFSYLGSATTSRHIWINSHIGIEYIGVRGY